LISFELIISSLLFKRDSNSFNSDSFFVNAFLNSSINAPSLFPTFKRATCAVKSLFSLIDFLHNPKKQKKGIMMNGKI